MGNGPDAIRTWAGPRRVDRGNPLAGPAALSESAVIRVAWAGRTSTYDQQDPTLSLPRQLRACHYVLPDIAVITAHFYDVESGRKDLAERGHGHAHELFQIPIPRDGGIQDLLEEADRPDRRFDVVICESIDRISRRTYIATEIEHRLEQAGVLLLVADEPIRLGEQSGAGEVKTATQVLTRRVKQGVAEWYVTEMLEKSWDGFEVHTEAGFNVGKPCYGYRAKKVPAPRASQARQGDQEDPFGGPPGRGAGSAAGCSAGGSGSGGLSGDRRPAQHRFGNESATNAGRSGPDARGAGPTPTSGTCSQIRNIPGTWCGTVRPVRGRAATGPTRCPSGSGPKSRSMRYWSIWRPSCRHSRFLSTVNVPAPRPVAAATHKLGRCTGSVATCTAPCVGVGCSAT